MRYTITNDNCMSSTFRKVKDVDQFIRRVKDSHDRVRFFYDVDSAQATLEFNKAGYVRGNYILLRGVTSDDASVIRGYADNTQ